MKTIYNLVAELRQLSVRYNAIADALTEATSTITDEAISEAASNKPTVTLEQVRALLAEKGMAGHNAEVRALIERYGAKKLSEVSPVHYGKILEEAGAIG
jgi:hypothetical protein